MHVFIFAYIFISIQCNIYIYTIGLAIYWDGIVKHTINEYL